MRGHPHLDGHRTPTVTVLPMPCVTTTLLVYSPVPHSVWGSTTQTMDPKKRLWRLGRANGRTDSTCAACRWRAPAPRRCGAGGAPPVRPRAARRCPSFPRGVGHVGGHPFPASLHATSAGRPAARSGVAHPWLPWAPPPPASLPVQSARRRSDTRPFIGGGRGRGGGIGPARLLHLHHPPGGRRLVALPPRPAGPPPCPCPFLRFGSTPAPSPRLVRQRRCRMQVPDAAPNGGARRAAGGTGWRRGRPRPRRGGGHGPPRPAVGGVSGTAGGGGPRADHHDRGVIAIGGGGGGRHEWRPVGDGRGRARL